MRRGPIDEKSFEEWVRPHWAVMRRLAERMAGPSGRDDVLQEALLGAWQTRSSFDPELGHARIWLLAITANHAKKAARTARSRRYQLVPSTTPTAPEVRVDMERAITGLPERQRLAIELFYFVGLPVDDVAAVMGCANGTVKSTLSAARQSLETALGMEYS